MNIPFKLLLVISYALIGNQVCGQELVTSDGSGEVSEATASYCFNVTTKISGTTQSSYEEAVFVWQCISYTMVGLSVLAIIILFICLERKVQCCQHDYSHLREQIDQESSVSPPQSNINSETE